MSDHDTGAVWLAATTAIGLGVGLFAWVVFHAGTAALARYRARFTERAAFQAREFFLFIDPRHLLALNASAMALVGLLGWVVSGQWAIGLAMGVAMAWAPQQLYRWMRARRLARWETQLPDALQLVAGGLRAGAGLNAALQQLVAEAAPPLSQEFGLVLREQRLGVPLEQALQRLNRRMPTATTTLVVAAMRVAHETGGSLAETLERCASTLRSRQQMEGKIDALTAQGRLQAWVVGLLPLVLMAILSRMEPAAMSLLWTTHLGWGVLGLVAVLEVLGIVMIRRIVAIDV